MKKEIMPFLRLFAGFVVVGFIVFLLFCGFKGCIVRRRGTCDG